MLTGEQFNQTTKLPEKSYFNKVLAILIVVIFVLFIFIIYAAYLLNKNGLLTTGNLSDKRAIAAYLPKEPSIIYQRSGIITDIRPAFITVQSSLRTTSYDPAQAYQTQTLTLLIDANTIYTKRDFRNFNQTLVIPTAQTAIFSELVIGDYVQFVSNVNIKSLTSFYVTKVEKIIR